MKSFRCSAVRMDGIERGGGADMDMGWTRYTRQQEMAEYAKACEKEKRNNGLIVSEETILNCIDCELRDCGI